MGGFNKSIKALVAWRGGLFLTEGKIGVLSVSSLFLTLVGVYVGVCVCIRANTHALHRWGTRCEPRSRDETPGGPEESRWTKSWHTYIRICVQMCMYIMLRGGMRSWTTVTAFSLYTFFLPKAKDVNANHR
jgi:hypothetical protein